MRSLYLLFQLVFPVLLALIPTYVLSYDLNLNQTTNATDNANSSTEGSEGKFYDVPSRTRQSNIKRTDVRERAPVFLTMQPTNTKQVILFCRVGLFLHVDSNGTISSSLNQNSEYVKFELQSFGTSIVRILNIATGKYLAMDSKGQLETRTICVHLRKRHAMKRMKLSTTEQTAVSNENATNECLFYQNHEENSYVSFASFKYYMKEYYDMFIGIKRNGEVKKGTSTLPGQDSNLFLSLNLGNWRRNSRNDNF